MLSAACAVPATGKRFGQHKTNTSQRLWHSKQRSSALSNGIRPPGPKAFRAAEAPTTFAPTDAGRRKKARAEPAHPNPERKDNQEMARTTLAAAAALAAFMLAGCTSDIRRLYGLDSPSVPAAPDRVQASRNEACASTRDLECMNHFAFGWFSVPNDPDENRTDRKTYGSLTTLSPYTDSHSPPAAVSGTYSGKAFGFLVSDAARSNRINGTVSMEYMSTEKSLDISFRFPGNEMFNQNFDAVGIAHDCDDCFRGIGDAEHDPERVGSMFGGVFYGPASQEFGGWFWKGRRVASQNVILEASFGTARQ